jgi:zinc protease
MIAAVTIALALPARRPVAQDAGDVFPFPVRMTELGNGLKVVSVEYDSPEIMAFYTIVRTGSRNEVEDGFSGYAHFFEHMMFRGTEKYPTDVYNSVIKRLGADANAFTTDDWTAYHIVASSESLETIIDLESDRFLNLQYSESDFRTEAGAILGEYNLNFSNPLSLLRERLYDRAFLVHPYEHTTMGRLADIQKMPNHYDYSLEFYDRYYRPNNSIVVAVGDVDPDQLEALVEQYYGEWERGDFEPSIPVEPPQTRERSDAVTWTNPTLPFLMLGYHVPPFSDQAVDMPALDVLSELLFSQASPLFRKLYLEEQVVDLLTGGAVDHRDAPLFTILARVTDSTKVDYVRDTILAEIDRLKVESVEDTVLAATKSHMRYAFVRGLDNPASVAETMGHYLQLTEDPETVNRVYRLYDAVTADDIRRLVTTYFPESNRTVVTLTSEGT